MRHLAVFAFLLIIASLAHADDETVVTGVSINTANAIQAFESHCPQIDETISLFEHQNKTKVERILSLHMTQAFLARPGIDNSWFSDGEYGTKLFGEYADVLLEKNASAKISFLGHDDWLNCYPTYNN